MVVGKLAVQHGHAQKQYAPVSSLCPRMFLRTLTFGRIVVFGATAANLWFSMLVAITVFHARYGTLQAQEDLGLFMLIVAVSGSLAVACLFTLVIGALLNIRTLKYDASLLRNPVFVLGVINSMTPFVLVFLLRWLTR